MLAKTADVNRTIVLVPFNQAFLVVMANFICSVDRLAERDGVKLPLVFWPLDQIAYEWAKGKGLHPILYERDLFATMDFVVYGGPKDTPYFLMMRERGKVFKRIVHDLGYNMLFLDCDLVLLKNPLDLLAWDSSLEVQIDAWNQGMIYIEAFDPPPGPAEVKQRELSAAERRSEALKAPANPAPIPFFEPDSQWAWPHGHVTACAGAFFLKADEGGRYVAKRIAELLDERTDVDDQDALNILIAEESWVRNFAPLDRTEAVALMDQRPRYFTTRYLDQYKAINGHVYFTWSEAYDYYVSTLNLSSPYLVHANGRQDKRGAFKEKNIWFLDDIGQCIVGDIELNNNVI
ncbi:hypothetical protein HK101_009153 [Irineochytrium annulatum]|nr:hypothetical protein HK101_009153 [Irineochytrium annulatum]